jgi:aspartate/methionine/tyrosine aminotransferase
MAGLEALAKAENDVLEMVSEFRRRRDFISKALDSLPGIRCLCPPGAFYVFPNIQSFGMTSSAFADYLLNSVGVAVLSGSSFGEFGEGHIRISYATSMSNLAKAVQRIGEAVGKLRT